MDTTDVAIEIEEPKPEKVLDFEADDGICFSVMFDPDGPGFKVSVFIDGMTQTDFFRGIGRVAERMNWMSSLGGQKESYYLLRSKLLAGREMEKALIETKPPNPRLEGLGGLWFWWGLDALDQYDTDDVPQE